MLHWRQLDLCGSGLFPSAPGEPSAVFEQGRVEVSFEPLTRAAPDPGRVRLVLEEVDEDGEWVRLAVGAVGERRLHKPPKFVLQLGKNPQITLYNCPQN